MSLGVCVSHRHLIPYTIVRCTSEQKDFPAIALVDNNDIPWKTAPEDINDPASLILELQPGEQEQNSFNFFSLGIDRNQELSWPKRFRIEISEDMQSWTVLIHEDNFVPIAGDQNLWYLPLMTTKFIKVIIFEHYIKGEHFFSSIANLKIGINGIEKISASSELDRLWTKENIIDGRQDYGWSTSINQKMENESIEFNLGFINHINRVELRSKDAINPFFPQNFLFEYSKNGQLWYTLHEEGSFVAEGNSWYSWSFLPTNLSFFRIVITKGSQNEDNQFISQIIECKLFAVGMISDHTHPHEGITPYATNIHAGLVRLAKNGETNANVVIQGNDSRLKDGTPKNKGIVRFAENGEKSDLCAIQGSDYRLRDATEDYKGIVQLAKDGESRPAVVVQANDSRLKAASLDALGLVKLCPKGEFSSFKVIQGDDPRLRNASEDYPGIVRLAKNGENNANSVVQGNDNRLKAANTERLGIVKLAKDGETTPETVVQGNDKRLVDANENRKGIVRLARDGQSEVMLALQSNDSRLKTASEKNAGIVQFARHGLKTPLQAIQADDPRLYDKRQALEHSHDYAPLKHDFNDHQGHLLIEGDNGTNIEDTKKPEKDNALISARIKPEINQANAATKETYIAISGVCSTTNQGQAREIAILGHSQDIGLRGQAQGKSGLQSAGIQGHGRDCPGGRFFSRHDYALIAGSKNLEDGSSGSGKGLKVLGQTFLDGNVIVAAKTDSGQATISYDFPADSREPLDEGDVVCIHREKSGFVIKSNNAYDTAVIGVVCKDSTISIGQSVSQKNKDDLAIAISGIAKVKVDPSFGSIKPGDLLTTSKHSGHAMKAKISDFNQIGSIFGKALEEAKGKSTKIRVLLSHL